MAQEHRGRTGFPARGAFENEPADEWRDDYAKGGPVRSNEPERDWFFENNVGPPGMRDAAIAPARVASLASTVRRPSFKGRGPKGYRPSDERIRELVCERLTDDASIDASELLVEVKEGCVYLAGEVPTRQMKHAAEEIAHTVRGVTQVVNSARVMNERLASH